MGNTEEIERKLSFKLKKKNKYVLDEFYLITLQLRIVRKMITKMKLKLALIS